MFINMTDFYNNNIYSASINTPLQLQRNVPRMRQPSNLRGHRAEATKTCGVRSVTDCGSGCYARRFCWGVETESTHEEEANS